MATRSREDGRRQRYEAKVWNERAAVPEVFVPSHMALKEYLGHLYSHIDDSLSPEELTDYMRERYFSEGGLARFLSEGFPNTTSYKPFGPGQLRAIHIMESVIRVGGVEQLLEPRGYGKSSRVARAAIWALLGGFRKCGVVFQSSEPKAQETLAKIKNELAYSPFLQALSPAICVACRHASRSIAISRNQHHRNIPTHIEWLKGGIRLPNINDEVGGGGRILCMPFAKAAGAVFSDPETLEDIRPDLLLPDDPQAHDDCTSPGVTERLLSLWHGSVKYLGGRGRTTSTIFTQTVFCPDDMADQLSRDPSVHTVRYSFLEEFPKALDWWKGVYKQTLLNYDENVPDAQHLARVAANELYIANREMADEGARVSWEHAYDPTTTVSAIQQAMNNYLTNEQAFWAQDQNQPAALVREDDIRVKPKDILAKLHPEGRGVVPDWADRLICHIDVHDDLLYWAVCAGNSSMQMGLIDQGTFPKQGQLFFQHSRAYNTLEVMFPSLPTVQDRIRAGLNQLIPYLHGQPYATADGTKFKISTIGIDCGDGDHFDTIHAFCRDCLLTNLLPMRGCSPTASQVPMNARPKGRTEKRRGDHWIEKLSERTKHKWLEFDASYYKAKLHLGLAHPLGTSQSVSLWNSDTEHRMMASHCNAETPVFTVARMPNDVRNGVWSWTLQPGADNHCFDNFTGCLVLLSHNGAAFADAAPPVQRKRVKASEVQRGKRGLG